MTAVTLPVTQPFQTFAQQMAPITQLPVDIARLFASFLNGNEVALLANVCKNFSIIANDGRLWTLLFTQDFAYHNLDARHSAQEQYKERFLIERNWSRGTCKLNTVKTGLSWATPHLSIFQNFLFVEGPNSSFAAYDKNTLKHLYSCVGHLGIDFEGFQDDGDYLISRANGGPSSGAEIKVWKKDNGQLISHIWGCITYLVLCQY